VSADPRTSLSVRQERAILVKAILDDSPRTDDPLAELAELAAAAGAAVVSRVVQRRHAIHGATYIGKGKLEEIRQRADVFEANVVIFDNDLSPSQIREIEEATQRKVLDRS